MNTSNLAHLLINISFYSWWSLCFTSLL